MKNCLQCKKDFESKKSRTKFCSTNCRVANFRERGGKGVNNPEVRLKVIENRILDMLEHFEMLKGAELKEGSAGVQIIKKENISKKQELSEETEVSPLLHYWSKLEAVEDVYELNSFAEIIKNDTDLSWDEKNKLAAKGKIIFNNKFQ